MSFGRLEDLRIADKSKESSVTKKKIPWLWGVSIGGIVLLVLIIGLLFVVLSNREPKVKIESPAIINYEQPKGVFTAGGYIEAKMQVIVSSNAGGQIKEFLVKEGDEVEKGQVICYLKDDEYKAQLSKAQASYQYAKTKLYYALLSLKRGKHLQKLGVVSKEEREDLEVAYAAALNEVKQAVANLNEAEARHTYTTIIAPLSGTIIKQHVEVGEMVFPLGRSGSGIVTIGDLSKILTKVEINESDITKIRVGQKVSVMPDALPQHVYAGQVIEIAPIVDRQKGIVEIKIEIDNPDKLLMPGMSTKVVFEGIN